MPNRTPTVGPASSWHHAQHEEQECWSGVRHKLLSPDYIELKCAYWRKILAKCGVSEAELQNSPVLEVGCGPSGVFLLFPANPHYVLVDPLLDHYRNMAPHLFGTQHCISEPLEDLGSALNGGFQTVIAINCIDHCRDIHAFIRKLRNLCDDRATVLLAVNTHQRGWTARLWHRFQRFLEPHHPYHFTLEGYKELVAPHFAIENTFDIEDEVIWINRQTSNHVMPPPAGRSNFLTRLNKTVRSGEIFGRIFMRTLSRLGLPAHDFSGEGGRSIYRHCALRLLPK